MTTGAALSLMQQQQPQPQQQLLDDDDSIQKNYYNDLSSSSSIRLLPHNVVVPSIEAATRFMRLVSTCICMYTDYQVSTNIIRPYYYQSQQQQNQQHQQQEQIHYWEEQVRLRRRELDTAQATYATTTTTAAAKYNSSGSTTTTRSQSEGVAAENIMHRLTNDNDNNKELDYERQKREHKEQMHLAAERLVEAEERLASSLQLLGSSSSGDDNVQLLLDTNVDNDNHWYYATTQHEIHTRCAQRLLRLCQRNGGVYIKVGQHMATLDYLLPTEYIQTLSALYDNNPIMSYTDVCHVVQEELGQHPNELFDRFQPQPIASASLAQVHIAYDKNTGQKLAVKVQHRGLRETSQGDINNLVWAVRMAERWMPNSHFTFGWLADEIAPHLPQELDFINEGRNAETAQLHIQQTGLPCVIPRVLWDRTSSRVLTMEFEEGWKVTDVDQIDAAGLDRREVATLIASVMASQVFDSGHVHCDPHEANVLIRVADDHDRRQRRPVMVLVDHGLYRSLDMDFRHHYAMLWKSLLLADIPGITQACQNLGLENPNTSRLLAGVLLARPFDEIVERSKQGGGPSSLAGPRPGSIATATADHAIIRGYAQRYLPNIIALLSILPRQMLLLLKMNDCLRHIDYKLGTPPGHSLLVTGRYAARAVYRDILCQQRPAMSWWHRWCAWWSYIRLLIQIYIHEMGLWWLMNYNQQKSTTVVTSEGAAV